MKNIKINENIIIAMKSLVLTIIAIFVLQIMLSSMRGIGLKILSDSLIGNVLLEVVILMVQCWIIRKHSERKLLNTIGFSHERNSLKDVFIGIGIGLIGTALIYYAIFLMKIGFYEETGFKVYGSKIVIIFIISTFIRAFFAGVCEEVFFRGVLLNYLAKYKGKTFGLLVSSIVFTVFHCSRYQSFNQLLCVLLGGIVLGYLYIITESLYMSVGLHFATDFFLNLVQTKGKVGVLIFNMNTKFTLDYLDQISFILLSVMYLILFIILILINKNKEKKMFYN